MKRDPKFEEGDAVLALWIDALPNPWFIVEVYEPSHGGPRYDIEEYESDCEEWVAEEDLEGV